MNTSNTDNSFTNCDPIFPDNVMASKYNQNSFKALNTYQTNQIQNEDSCDLQQFKQSLLNGSHCQKHQEEFSLYCINDKNICCVDCAQRANQHKNHNLIPLKRAVNQIIQENLNYKKESKEMIIFLDDLIKQQKQVEIQYSTEYIDIQEQVNKEFAALSKMIKLREELFQNKIKGFYESKFSDAGKKLNEMLYIKNCLRDFRNLDQQNQQLDGLIYTFSIQKALKKILKTYQIIGSVQNTKNNVINFGQNRQQLYNELNNFGKLILDQPQNFKSHSKNQKSPVKHQISQRLRTKTQDKNLKKCQPNIDLNNYMTQTKMSEYNSIDKTQKKTTIFCQNSLAQKVSKSTQNLQKSVEDLNIKKECSKEHKQLEQNRAYSMNRLSFPNLQNIQQAIQQIENQFQDIDQFLIYSKIIDKNMLVNLHELVPPQINNLRLLYCMNEHGKNSQIMHQRCDNQGPQIVLVKSNDYIFGYYNSNSIQKLERYASSECCWIFSLVNPSQMGPQKFLIRDDKKFISLYQSNKSPCLGSTLQNKQDLFINYDEPQKSCSYLGYAYNYQIQDVRGDQFLVGKYSDWDVQEIEIYTFNP